MIWKTKTKPEEKVELFSCEVENVRKYVEIQTIVFVSILCKML